MAKDGRELWITAIKVCFARRLRPEEVDEALASLHSTNPIESEVLAGILLDIATKTSQTCDPLTTAYLSHLIGASHLSPADVLVISLEAQSALLRGDRSRRALFRKLSSRSHQEAIFTLLSNHYAASDGSIPTKDLAAALGALLHYMKASNTHEAGGNLEGNGLHDMQPDRVAAYENAAAIFVIIFSNVNFKKRLIEVITGG